MGIDCKMKDIEKRLAQIENRWDELLSTVHDPALFETMPRDLAVRWFSYWTKRLRRRNREAKVIETRRSPCFIA